MPRRNKRQQPLSTKVSTNPETYKARAEADRKHRELLADLMAERYGLPPDPEREPDDQGASEETGREW